MTFSSLQRARVVLREGSGRAPRVIRHARLKFKVLNVTLQAQSISASELWGVFTGPFLTSPVITGTHTLSSFVVFGTREKLEMGLLFLGQDSSTSRSYAGDQTEPEEYPVALSLTIRRGTYSPVEDTGRAQSGAGAMTGEALPSWLAGRVFFTHALWSPGVLGGASVGQGAGVQGCKLKGPGGCQGPRAALLSTYRASYSSLVTYF